MGNFFTQTNIVFQLCQYIRCNNGEPVVEMCAAGLYWNQNILSCDWPSNVDTSKCTIP